MVVVTRPSWSRILKQTGRPLLIVTIISTVTSALNYFDHPFRPLSVPDLTLSLLGAALGILLGFRTNSAYDRWWEARKLWGQLVNSSRSLAREAVAFTRHSSHPGAKELGKQLVYLQIAFVHALRCHLRKQETWTDIEPFLDKDFSAGLRAEKNVPNAILQHMGNVSARAADEQIFTEWRLQLLENTYTDLANVQGACERIKNTPLPRQYDFYPELFVKAYCTILPLVLVDELKLWTPLATVVISFAFLVLNRIGKNLEDPFENTVYDTPMTALSRTIEINLRQVLGETELPSPVLPVEGVLF